MSKLSGSPPPGAYACLININFPPLFNMLCALSPELAINDVLKDISKNRIILTSFIDEH
tara:strand:- start:310 stop:486 length:177 start_codon:yes stop_codon:yes gene_type:complete